MAWSSRLEALAQRISDRLPADIAPEIILTGSVSRGMADAASDIEMVVVTGEVIGLDDCFRLAQAAGLERLDTWGAPDEQVRRVSGRCEQVPIELLWWPREFADARVDTLLRTGEPSSAADALVYGVPMRTCGLLAAWQQRLATYPEDLAAAQIEEAALPWGGFHSSGVLTLVRPGERLALTEWMFDGAIRVLTIVFALNRVWRPTTKRLPVRVAPLLTKPDRLAERIELAFSEQDLRRALLVMTELQLDAVLLAPSGPNVDRARIWLAEAADLLR